MKLKYSVVIFVFFCSIPFPLFIRPNGSVFRGGSLDADAFSLPISLFILMLICIVVPSLCKRIVAKQSQWVLYYILYSLFLFVVYSIPTQTFNPLLIAISILPLSLSFLIGQQSYLSYIKGAIDLNKMIRYCVYFFGFITSLHLLSSLISYGLIGAFINRGEDSLFGLFSIYQKFVYYPTMLASIFILSIYQRGKVIFASSLLILLAVLMVGSRESMLIVAIGVFSKLYWYNRNGHKNNIVFFMFVFVVILSVLVFYSSNLLDYFEEATFIDKFKSISESGDYSAGRLGAIYKVFLASSRDFNLLFGTGFSMYLGDMRTPHNQYLEVFLRSGIIGALLFFMLIFSSVHNGYIKCKEHFFFRVDSHSIFSMYLVLIILTFVSFNINTPVRAPYTSVLVGFLLGFFSIKRVNLV